MQPFKISIHQIDPKIANRARNRAAILSGIEAAAAAGSSLAVFPECALSGYVFDSAVSALPASESVPGETTEAVVEACRRLGMTAIVGMLEREGDELYNTAFVAGPSGLIAVYRKCHLPVLGIDRYVGLGGEIPTIDLPFARIGILICYDIRFPEPARSLALRGVDLIVVPTNWPQGAEGAPDYVTRTRAAENRVYVAACDRVGEERGTSFIGRSQVVAPDGTLLAEADGHSETMLLAEIDPARARQKRIVIRPGEYEMDPVGGRRPELYGDVAR